ncbi:MAG: hypothetical protein ABIP78_10345 [Pyrinomonadaceae bacterium]
MESVDKNPLPIAGTTLPPIIASAAAVSFATLTGIIVPRGALSLAAIS